MNQQIDFKEPDEVFRITCILREGSYLKGEALLARLLNGSAPTPENVRALYVFAIERLDSRLEPRVCAVCAEWLTAHNLPIPEDKPRLLFDQFLDEGLIDADDYKEIMDRGKA